MSFKDKLKAQAEHALAVGKVAAEKGVEIGKEGLAQGQAKVKEMQEKRAAEHDTPPTPDTPSADDGSDSSRA